jgi:hypothetical protein
VGDNWTFAGGGGRGGSAGHREDAGGRAVLGCNVIVKNRAKEMAVVTHIGRRTRTAIDTGDDITNSVDSRPCLGIFDPALFRKFPNIVGQLGCLVGIRPLRPDILLHDKSLEVITDVAKRDLVGVDLVAWLQTISQEVRRGKMCAYFENNHAKCVDI